MTLRASRLLTALLLLLAVGLAALLVWEWRQGRALASRYEVQVKSSKGQAEPLKLDKPFLLQPLPAYEVIVQRPITSPTRLPPPVAAASSVAPPRKFVLTGIAQNPSEAIVLLRDLQTGATERLRAGVPASDGLQLQSVEGDTATVRQGSVEEKYTLQVLPSAGRQSPLIPQTPSASPPSQPSTSPLLAASAASSSVSRPVSPVAPAEVKPQTSPNPGLQLLNQQRIKNGLPPINP